jgi:hypothetical protein
MDDPINKSKPFARLVSQTNGLLENIMEKLYAVARRLAHRGIRASLIKDVPAASIFIYNLWVTAIRLARTIIGAI